VNALDTSLQLSLSGSTFSERLQCIRKDGKGILVVGLGITGVETARFLRRVGIAVVCTERQSEEGFRAKSKFAALVDELRDTGVKVLFGIDGEMVVDHLAGIALAVLSPGVPLESSIVGAIARRGVPYVSELELGVEIHGGKSIVVTGSNGKSTTVSLIDHILHTAGVKSFLCGNVGTPVLASDEIYEVRENSSERSTAKRSVLVVEASSYQLEACTVLKPAVSVILNITDNHLERHGSIERYAAAKGRIARLQDKEDIVIVNADDAVVRSLAQSFTASCAFFGTQPEQELCKRSEKWASIRHVPGGTSSITVGWGSAVEEYALTDIALLGLHNRYNIAAAILAVSAVGISSAHIRDAVNTFNPLEHRLEIVMRAGEERSHTAVINDSKSTTVAATLAAYVTVREHFAGQPLTLMIGRLSKAGSWEPLLGKIAPGETATSPIICFGKDGELLASHCRAKGLAYVVCSTLKEATATALDRIEDSSGVILLSPGCASFDEFSDFEHRGAEFKRYVRELAQA